VGETPNRPLQLSFNPALKVEFQGSRVTSDGGLILVRELDERLGFSDLIAQHLTGILAAGIGVFAMGLLTTAAEVSAGVAGALNWYGPVGPLSGKSIGAIIVWLVAWVVLGSGWRGKEVAFGPVYRWTLVLVVLGVLLTFPPFFDLFA